MPRFLDARDTRDPSPRPVSASPGGGGQEAAVNPRETVARARANETRLA
jgi:hypothetical protein